jgi:ABC-type sugar transport system permease subunit/ABC-type glycerol-3-phosphate transport system substrate-binding protein
MAQRTRIDVWHVYTDRLAREVIEDARRRFERENPQYQVRLLAIPWNSQQKLLTAVVGGVPPDVAFIDRPRLAQWASQGALRPLDDFIARDNFDGSRFFETTWEETSWEGSRYAIPINTDARVLYYNKALFRELGLDPDRPPRTWKELEVASDKLTTRDAAGRLQRIGFAPLFGNAGFGTAILYTYVWQQGGEILSEDGEHVLIDEQPWVTALEQTVAWRDRYGHRDLASFATGLGGYSNDPFISGRIAMIEHGTWYLSMLRRYGGDLDFGVTSIPIPDGGQPAFLSAGWSVAIPSGAANPEGAWAFIKFFTDRPSQEVLAQTLGAIPANREATHIPHFTEDPHWRVILDLMPHSRHHPVSPHGMLVYTTIQGVVEQAIVQNVPPRVALEQARRSIEEEIRRGQANADAQPLDWARVNRVIIGVLLAVAIAYLAYFAVRMRSMGIRRAEGIAGLVMASPFLLGLLVFSGGPILASAVYSFCHYTILKPASFVGLENYRRLLREDPLFWTSVHNTLYFALVGVPLMVSFALVLALLLNQPVRGRRLFRTIFFLPSIISGVAVSILWLWLLNPETGLINSALGLVGVRGPLWLQSTEWAKPAIILMSLWGVGGSMIIFLAGLQGIPRHLYEVAVLDGAGPWTRFWSVTFPFLTPTIFFNVLVGFIGAFQIFTPAYVMTSGGPADSTLFYALYLFRQGFEYFSMGYASALAWVLFAIVMVASAIQLIVGRYWVYYGTSRHEPARRQV